MTSGNGPCPKQTTSPSSPPPPARPATYPFKNKEGICQLPTISCSYFCEWKASTTYWWSDFVVFISTFVLKWRDVDTRQQQIKFDEYCLTSTVAKDGNRKVTDNVQNLYFSFLMTLLYTVLIIMFHSSLL